MKRSAHPDRLTDPCVAVLLAALGVALPATAAAAGTPLALDCQPLAPPADEVAAEEAPPLPARPDFTLARLRPAKGGAGAIEATGPDGRTVPGVTASDTGPFAWTADSVLNTLTVKGTTADGRTLVLWHRLDQAQTAVPPVGHLTKLICEIS